MNKIIILGNGSSLKNFDFKQKLQNIDTIGTCAAYRYWYKINWFPTHYVNADHVVLDSHGENIKKMILEKKCQTFLLRKSYINFWKDCINHNNVLFLEDLQKNSNILKKMIEFGTGNVATFYAIHLNYIDIRLLGIDCDYVEFIPDCSKMSDGSLIINETPSFNPNYFINDYQQKGDRYNIPNGKRVHLTSWIQLSKIQHLFNCKITNYNYKTSLDKLFTKIEDISKVNL